MRVLGCSLRFLLLPVLWWGFYAVSAPAQTPDQVLIVANKNLKESREIAEYYRSRRGIPEKNLCLIEPTTGPVISSEEFQGEIVKPLADHLVVNKLQDQILYIVTIRGVPIAVRESRTGELTSVDSKLTLLYGYLVYGGYSRDGRIDNPYFRGERSPKGLQIFTRAQYDIYLVTRLTGPDSASVKSLINRGFAADRGGTFFFSRSSEESWLASDWVTQSLESIEQSGNSVRVEKSTARMAEMGPIAGYAGWDPLRGASSRTEMQDVRWLPGALALSFDRVVSSHRGNKPVRGSLAAGSEEEYLEASIVKYLEEGATGLGASVADPTLDGSFRPQILFPAYLRGHNLAESFFLATRYLGWKNLVIGDPLVNPYGVQATKARWEAYQHTDIDAETGLPRYFLERRSRFLSQRYSVSQDAIRLFLRAEEAVRREHEEEARTLLLKSLELNSDLPEAQLLMAELEERRGDMRRAFEHYRLVHDLGVERADLLKRLGRLALEELEEPQTAAPYIESLYRDFNSLDPEASRLWARLQYELGDLAEAERVLLSQIRRRTRPSAEDLALLALIFRDQEKMDQAEDFAKRAIEVEREDALRVFPGIEALLSTRNEGIIEPAGEEEKPVAKLESGFRETESSDRALYRPAQVLYRTSPDYPLRASQRGREGTVVLRLLIDRMGQLVKSEVVHGEALLAKSAVQAVRQWKFTPELVNGKPQPSYLTVSLSFKLERLN